MAEGVAASASLLLLGLIAFRDQGRFLDVALVTGIALAALAVVIEIAVQPNEPWSRGQWISWQENCSFFRVLVGQAIAGQTYGRADCSRASVSLRRSFRADIVPDSAGSSDALVLAILMAAAATTFWGATSWFPIGQDFTERSTTGFAIGLGATIALATLLRSVWPSESRIRSIHNPGLSLDLIGLVAGGFLLLVLTVPDYGEATATAVLLIGAGSFAQSGTGERRVPSLSRGSDATISVLITAGLALASVVWLAQGGMEANAWTAVGSASVALTAAIVLLVSRWRDLELKSAETEASNALLIRESETDPLTGLRNRRAIERRLSEETERARRFDHPLSVAFIDLDNFKQINDHYGHAVGDQVLVSAASSIAASLRAIDVAGRYGGEEFLLLLPETEAEGAGIALGRVLERIRLDAL